MQNYSTHKKFYPLIKAGIFLFLMMQLGFYKSLHRKKKFKNPEWILWLQEMCLVLED